MFPPDRAPFVRSVPLRVILIYGCILKFFLKIINSFSEFNVYFDFNLLFQHLNYGFYTFICFLTCRFTKQVGSSIPFDASCRVRAGSRRTSRRIYWPRRSRAMKIEMHVFINTHSNSNEPHPSENPYFSPPAKRKKAAEQNCGPSAVFLFSVNLRHAALSQTD